MKSKYIVKTGFIGLVAGLALTACNDDWDTHYDRNGSVPEISLMELIGQDEQLTKFHEILKKTQCDTLLNSAQTYTVWAPVNEALANVNMNDLENLRRMVRNHIARYAHPSSTPVTKKIGMLNSKTMNYESGNVFNEVELLKKDIVAQNGVLHKLSDTITYKYNFMEYLATQENYSKAYEFISSFYEKVYDESLSTAYDSVFVDYNPLLKSTYLGIGDIENEDSVYTMILPDNQAWETAYEYVKPYFKVFVNKKQPQEYADSVQHVQTGLALLNGLTFRGQIADPATADSLTTVTRHVIHKTAPYFAGYTQGEASNGTIYFANNTLNMDDTCTWNLPLRVEAEAMDSRQTASGTNVYIRNVNGNSLVQKVSESRYLEVRGKYVTDNPGVTFKVVNTLAGKYDVYVDFVSPVVDGENFSEEKTRVTFMLKYATATGGTKTLNNKSDDLIVGGWGDDGRITLKAWEGVELPVSNYYDNMWYLDETHTQADIVATTTLQVKTAVRENEFNSREFVRKFRVDRIRFVPVK